jgi:hypothetical protein
MTGRKQQISLAGGCWRHGIVVHEIGKLTTMLKLYSLLCGEEMLNIDFRPTSGLSSYNEQRLFT